MKKLLSVFIAVALMLAVVTLSVGVGANEGNRIYISTDQITIEAGEDVLAEGVELKIGNLSSEYVNAIKADITNEIENEITGTLYDLKGSTIEKIVAYSTEYTIPEDTYVIAHNPVKFCCKIPDNFDLEKRIYLGFYSVGVYESIRHVGINFEFNPKIDVENRICYDDYFYFNEDADAIFLMQTDEPYFTDNFKTGFVLDTEIKTGQNSQGEGWSWNGTTNVLTLNGANLVDDEEYGTAVLLPLDSTIEVIGENKIISEERIGSSDSVAIVGKGNLTLIGNGTLETRGTVQTFYDGSFDEGISEAGVYDGIRAAITLDGPTWKQTSNGDYDASVWAQKMIVNSGELIVKTTGHDALALGTDDGELVINSGTVTLTNISTLTPDDIGSYVQGFAGVLNVPDYATVKANDGQGNYTVDIERADVEYPFSNDGSTFKAYVIKGTKEIAKDIKIIVPKTAINEEKEGVSVSADNRVFPPDTTVKIEKLTSGSMFEIVENSLSSITSKRLAFDITAVNGGVAIQPNGKIEVTFSVPADFDFDKSDIYYVKPDGNYEKLAGVKNKDNRTITVTLDHLSTYVIAEAKDEVTVVKPAEPTIKSPKTGNDLSAYFLTSFFALFAMVSSLIILKKKVNNI